MSNPPANWLSNSGFNRYKGSYFNNDIDCSGGNIICRTGNLYLKPNAAIYTPANSIIFNDASFQTIIGNNLTVTGTSTFVATAGITNGINLINTPSANVLLTNTKLGYLQDVSSNIQAQFLNVVRTNVINNFSSSQTFQQNIRLQLGLILNNGALTLSNDNLTRIQYLSNVSTDISGSITPLQTKTTNINYTLGTNTTAFTGVLSFPTGSISTASLNILGNTNTWTDSQTFTKIMYLTSDLSINGELVAGGTIISNNTLKNIQYLSSVSSNVQNQINSIDTSALLSTTNSWTGVNTFDNNLYFTGYKTIYTPSNSIYFDDTYAYTNFNNNVHIYGNFQLDYGATTYDVGYELSNTNYRLTNISYDSGTNTTTITGNLSIPSSTLSGYVDLTTDQTIAGIKTFSSPPVMSGASISSATIPDSALVTSYVPASSASTIAGIKTFSSPPVMSGASITIGTIPSSAIASGVCLLAGTQTLSGQKTFQLAPVFSNGIVANVTSISNTELGYLNNCTANIQLQINSCAKTNATNTFATGVQIFSNNLRLDGSLLCGTAGGTTITNATLVKINNISNTTGDVQSAIDTLNTRTTGMTYTTGSTNFASSVGVLGGQFAVYDPSGTTFYVPPARTFDITGSTATDRVEEIILQGVAQSNISFQGGGDASGTYCNFGIFYMNGIPLVTARKPIMHMKTTGSITTDTLIIDSNTLSTKSITFTGTLNTISAATYGFLSGVTSSIQVQLDNIVSSISNFVSKTGTETIGGLKTFSSLITAQAGIAISGAFSIVSANSAGFSIIGTDYKGGTSGDIVSETQFVTSGKGVCIQGGKTGTQDAFGLYFYNGGTRVNIMECVNANTPTTDNNVQVYCKMSAIAMSGNNIYCKGYDVLNDYQPIGTIIQNVSGTLSLPLLLCNGQAISRTGSYAALFALIGTTYGSGDGSTTFNIPNYSGAFLRGMGSQTQGSITYASAANPYTYQADQMRSHTHNGQSGSYLNTGTSAVTINGYAPVATTRPTSSTFASTGGVNSGGNGAETRSFNYGIYYYIRVI